MSVCNDINLQYTADESETNPQNQVINELAWSTSSYMVISLIFGLVGIFKQEDFGRVLERKGEKQYQMVMEGGET